jgi:protein disulfide-isomerase-like protein
VAHVKSEPELSEEENSGPVRTLVGTTFDNEVMQSEQDVFVEFYAPWCGHCKALAPIWEELGIAFASSPSVKIAKIDGTANDHAVKDRVGGFPTLMLFSSSTGKSGVLYEGDRTLEAMTSWLKSNVAGLASSEAAAAEAAHSEL